VSLDRASVDLTPEAESTSGVNAVNRRSIDLNVLRGVETALSKPGGGDVDCGGGEGLLVRRSPIEPDKCVQVDRAALLVLAYLGELHAKEIPRGLLAHAQVSRHETTQADREPPPQLRAVPLPDCLPLVVVAVPAQRLSDQCIISGVEFRAPTRATVLAQSRCSVDGARPRLGTRTSRRVHSAERRCGQREEHQRVSGDALRDPLVAAGDTCGEEVPHVALVLMGARGAARGTAIAATDVENAVRQVAAVECAQVLPGPAVEGTCLAKEADGTGAEPRRGDLLGPVLEAVGEHPCQCGRVLDVEAVEIGIDHDAAPSESDLLRARARELRGFSAGSGTTTGIVDGAGNCSAAARIRSSSTNAARTRIGSEPSSGTT